MAAQIREVTGNTQTAMIITKQRDGFSWTITYVAPEYTVTEDYLKVEKWSYTEGIAVVATPQTALYPWKKPAKVKAAGLAVALRKQRSKNFKRSLNYNLEPIISKLENRSRASTWRAAALLQQPVQLWNRQELLTDYQNWTIYRITLGELQLRHPGWPDNRGCSAETCTCPLETIDHIVWECSHAQIAWKSWIDHWLGKPSTPTERENYKTFLACRTAPPIPVKFLERAQQCIGRWTPDHDAAMRTLWFIWTSITPVTLWKLRNRRIFEGIATTVTEAGTIVWAAGRHQTKAIAANWKSRPETRIRGHCLEVCYQVMTTFNSVQETATLDAWLLRYYSGNRHDLLEGGGWLAYRYDTQTPWKLQAAASQKFETRGKRKDNAQLVLQHGLNHIVQAAEPSTVLLRVESLEASFPISQNVQEPNTSPVSIALSRFFAVQWTRPCLRDLEPAKFLAQQDSPTIYDFNQASDTNPTENCIRTYLERTATPTTKIGSTGNDPKKRQAVSLRDCLIAYQASIGPQ